MFSSISVEANIRSWFKHIYSVWSWLFSRFSLVTGTENSRKAAQRSEMNVRPFGSWTCHCSEIWASFWGSECKPQTLKHRRSSVKLFPLCEGVLLNIIVCNMFDFVLSVVLWLGDVQMCSCVNECVCYGEWVLTVCPVCRAQRGRMEGSGGMVWVKDRPVGERKEERGRESRIQERGTESE